MRFMHSVYLMKSTDRNTRLYKQPSEILKKLPTALHNKLSSGLLSHTKFPKYIAWTNMIYNAKKVTFGVTKKLSINVELHQNSIFPFPCHF